MLHMYFELLCSMPRLASKIMYQSFPNAKKKKKKKKKNHTMLAAKAWNVTLATSTTIRVRLAPNSSVRIKPPATLSKRVGVSETCCHTPNTSF